LKILFPHSEEIPLLQLIPKTSENRSFYQNGLSKLIPRLRLKVHSNIDECHKLWEKFSPKQSLFDLWDFRHTFYKGYQNTPYFFTIYNGVNPVCFLPLTYDYENKRYEWFGSDWHEENKFYYNNPILFSLIKAIFPTPLELNAIAPESLPKPDKDFVNDDPQYVLSIKNVDTIESLLQLFNKKRRYNLKREYQRIQTMSPTIEWIENKEAQLKYILKLKELSLARFLEEENISAFNSDDHFECSLNIVKEQGTYKIHILVITIDNKIAGIDVIAIYKSNYYLLEGANDIDNFPGIGSFMTYLEFEDAIKRKMGLINALQEDHNWKHKYFTARPMLKLAQ